MNRLSVNEQLLMLAYGALFTVAFLYIGRGVDDNTLASWRWVFGARGFARTFVVLTAAVFLVAFRGPRKPPARPLLPGLFAALVVIPAWSAPEMLTDAARYFTAAKHIEIYGAGFFLENWGGSIPAWTDLPLVPFLYGVLFSIFGESRPVVQAFNSLVFGATVICVFQIGRRLWDETTGYLAGLFLLASPYLLGQVPMMLVDIHTMFLLTLALYVCLQWFETGKGRFFPLSVLALTAALNAKYSAWLALPAFSALAWVCNGNDRRRTLERAGLTAAVTFVLIGALFLARRDLFIGQIELIRSYSLPALGGWREGYASTFLFQIHPFVPVAALIGLMRALKSGDRRFLLPAMGLLPVLLMDVQRARYLLPFFPFAALAAGYGLGAIRDLRVKTAVAHVAVITSLVLLYSVYVPFFRTTSMGNLLTAGRYLDTRGVSSVRIVTTPQRTSHGNTAVAIPLLDLYTRARIVTQPPRRSSLDDAPRRSWSRDQKAGAYTDAKTSLHIAKSDRPFVEKTRLGKSWVKKLETAPLRFTWEIGNPEYYESTVPEKLDAVVLITSEPEAALRLTGNYSRAASFVGRSGVFRFKTFVHLYQREEAVTRKRSCTSGTAPLSRAGPAAPVRNGPPRFPVWPVWASDPGPGRDVLVPNPTQNPC